MNKKRLLISISILLIIGFTILLSIKHYNISVPKAGDINSISVSFNQSDFCNLSGEESKNLLTLLSSIKSSVHSSVNDTPYVDAYYTINMEGNNSHYTFYIYELGSSYYVEQPYNGRYKIKKNLYDSIVSIINRAF